MSEDMKTLFPRICEGFSHLTENQKWYLLGFCARLSMERDNPAPLEHGVEEPVERPRTAAGA